MEFPPVAAPAFDCHAACHGLPIPPPGEAAPPPGASLPSDPASYADWAAERHDASEVSIRQRRRASDDGVTIGASGVFGNSCSNVATCIDSPPFRPKFSRSSNRRDCTVLELHLLSCTGTGEAAGARSEVSMAHETQTHGEPLDARSLIVGAPASEPRAPGRQRRWTEPARSIRAALAACANRLVEVRLGIASSLFAAIRHKHAPTAAHSLRVALGCSSWALSFWHAANRSRRTRGCRAASRYWQNRRARPIAIQTWHSGARRAKAHRPIPSHRLEHSDQLLRLSRRARRDPSFGRMVQRHCAANIRWWAERFRSARECWRSQTLSTP